MADEQEVHSITTAVVPLSNDQKARETRYLWSMSLRTVCFIAGIITTGVWRWTFMAGAVFLPYFAVIIANAGRERGAWRGNGAFMDNKNELT